METVNGLAVTALTKEQFYAACRQVPLALTVTPALGGGIRSVQVEPAVFEAKRRPQGRRLGDDVGYLALPAVMSLEAGKPYAAWAHHLIQEIDQPPTVGWVIDLRTNLGGSLWPMLASVGPVVGEGAIMGFVAPGEKLIAFYRAGRAWIEGQERISSQVDQPYTLKRPNPPVAVLTSQLTTSAGELTALAFRGRPHARSFGEPTAGVPTANVDKTLSDEAAIYLTAYLGADRTGQTYARPLFPDEPGSLDWPRFGADDDPILEAAVRWLRGQADAL